MNENPRQKSKTWHLIPLISFYLSLNSIKTSKKSNKKTHKETTLSLIRKGLYASKENISWPVSNMKWSKMLGFPMQLQKQITDSSRYDFLKVRYYKRNFSSLVRFIIIFVLFKEMSNIHSYILGCSSISRKIISSRFWTTTLRRIKFFHSMIIRRNRELSHNMAATHSFQTPVYKLVYPVDSYAGASDKMLSSTIWNGSKNVRLAASCQWSLSQS